MGGAADTTAGGGRADSNPCFRICRRTNLLSSPGEHDRGKRGVRERERRCANAQSRKNGTRGPEGQKGKTEAWGKEAELLQLKVKSKTDPPPSKANAVIRQSPHIKALLPVTDMFNQPPPGGTHHASLWLPAQLSLEGQVFVFRAAPSQCKNRHFTAAGRRHQQYLWLRGGGAVGP